MQITIRGAVVSGALILCAAGHFMQAQQHQRKTFVYSDGEKTVVDTNTGWTVFDKSGKEGSNITADQLRGTCEEIDKQTAPSPALALLALPCEFWAELQPHTQIERVPFLTFIARLFVVTPSYTDFARYRGLELQSTKEGKAYDSIILPSDIGNDISCTIKAVNLPDKTFAIYNCSINTSSYQDAIQLEEHLVHLLAPLNLPEDQVEEHGKSAQARAEGRCAPSGECEDQHEYSTVKKDGKMLQITADPDFTYDARSSAATGHLVIGGVSQGSATVTVKVYSVAPKNPTSAADRIPATGSEHQ